jgi:HAD superfamily hydrolase (TIGR01509 family)
MIEAIIFDVDGTLVDSVDLHAQAWVEAFAQFGKRVGFNDVRSQIGKGGDQLLPVFLSRQERAEFGKQLEAWRGEFFVTHEQPRVLPFPRVRPLFQALHDRGLKLVLGTSGTQDQIDFNKRACNISDLVDVEVTAEDVARSKPHPDIFMAALDKLGRPDPRSVLVVGDSPYDAIAAQRAGLRRLPRG